MQRVKCHQTFLKFANFILGLNIKNYIKQLSAQFHLHFNPGTKADNFQNNEKEILK